MRLGIRWKLMIGIGVPLAALLTISLALDFQRQRRDEQQRMEARLTKDSQYFAARLDTQFQTLAQIARSTAAFLDTHPDVKEAELYELLRRNVEQSSLIYGSCIAFEPHSFEPQRRLFAPYVYKGIGNEPGRGPDGLLRMDVANAYDYMDPKWEWFHGPRSSGKPMWTEPFFDEGAGNVIMCTYVAPFFRDGKFRGTVNIDVKLEDLQEFAGRMNTEESSVAIVSHLGTFVSWPDPSVIMHETVDTMAKKAQRPDIAALGRRMMAGAMATERIGSLEDPGKRIFISYSPIPSTGWSFGAMAEESTMMAPVFSELRVRALSAVALIAVIVGVILAISVWLTRPIERLAGAVVQIGARGLDAPEIRSRRNDEIGDLARSFNTMISQLRGHVEALTRETRAREAVESELRIAREIQRSLLPRQFPVRPDFDLHAFSGAARQVAGDFYDFFDLPDGRQALVIADVCGKGVPAAMFMAVARTVVRDLAMNGRSPADLLNEANRLLLADNTRGLFVTIIVAFYDPITGLVRYANGGHPRPYLLGHEGAPRHFGEVTGTVVGVMGDQRWTQAEGELAPGQTIVMFTDGVPDARRSGGPMFGEDRLAEVLGVLHDAPPREICARIVDRLVEHAASDWHDDVTLLVFRRKA